MHGPGTRPGQRKRINPFAQTRRALDELFVKTGIDPTSVPTHIAAVFPDMSAQAYPWGPSPHLLFAEQLEQARLRYALGASRTSTVANIQSAALCRLIAVLNS